MDDQQTDLLNLNRVVILQLSLAFARIRAK